MPRARSDTLGVEELAEAMASPEKRPKTAPAKAVEPPKPSLAPEEIAWALTKPVPLEEAMRPVAPTVIAGPPVAMPETPEQLLERLGPEAVRHVGERSSDVPPRAFVAKRLTITELDGKVSSFDTIGDPVYVRVEWTTRDTPTPWIPEQVDSRFGLGSIESIVLEFVDVEPD